MSKSIGYNKKCILSFISVNKTSNICGTANEANLISRGNKYILPDYEVFMWNNCKIECVEFLRNMFDVKKKIKILRVSFFQTLQSYFSL